MNKKFAAAVLLLITAALLTGCLYPGNSGGSKTASPGEYLILVENAVLAYKNRTGVLPVHNSRIDTPVYEKYRVDFAELLDYNVISRIPPDAFEAGGNYYYMMVNPDNNLQIKLLDLRVSIAAADIQRLVNDYYQRESAYPFGKPVADQFYVLDFQLLGRKQEQARSVYTGQYLVYLLHESGKVTVDYAPDIMRLLQESGVSPAAEGQDLRHMLVDNSPFVPVNSFPYYWNGEAPIIAAQ